MDDNSSIHGMMKGSVRSGVPFYLANYKNLPYLKEDLWTNILLNSTMQTFKRVVMWGIS